MHIVSAIPACVHFASSLHSTSARIAPSQLTRTRSASCAAASAAVAHTAPEAKGESPDGRGGGASSGGKGCE